MDLPTGILHRMVKLENFKTKFGDTLLVHVGEDPPILFPKKYVSAFGGEKLEASNKKLVDFPMSFTIDEKKRGTIVPEVNKILRNKIPIMELTAEEKFIHALYV